MAPEDNRDKLLKDDIQAFILELIESHRDHLKMVRSGTCCTNIV